METPRFCFLYFGILYWLSYKCRVVTFFYFASVREMSVFISEVFFCLLTTNFHMISLSMISIFYLPTSFFFLGLYLQHMEVPRLGVELELHLPAYATATATWD